MAADQGGREALNSVHAHCTYGIYSDLDAPKSFAVEWDLEPGPKKERKLQGMKKICENYQFLLHCVKISFIIRLVLLDTHISQ